PLWGRRGAVLDDLPHAPGPGPDLRREAHRDRTLLREQGVERRAPGLAPARGRGPDPDPRVPADAVARGPLDPVAIRERGEGRDALPQDLPSERGRQRALPLHLARVLPMVPR